MGVTASQAQVYLPHCKSKSNLLWKPLRTTDHHTSITSGTRVSGRPKSIRIDALSQARRDHHHFLQIIPCVTSQFPSSYDLYLTCRILLKLQGKVSHMVRNLSSTVQRVTLVRLFGSLEYIVEPKLVRVVAGMHHSFENANPKLIINQSSQVTTLSYILRCATFHYFPSNPASCNITVIAWHVLPSYANMVRYVSRTYQPFGFTDKNIYI